MGTPTVWSATDGMINVVRSRENGKARNIQLINEVTHATEIFLLSPALPARRSPLEGGRGGVFSDCAAMTE